MLRIDTGLTAGPVFVDALAAVPHPYLTGRGQCTRRLQLRDVWVEQTERGPGTRSSSLAKAIRERALAASLGS